MAGWVYEIRNTVNGRVYIGSTADDRRFKRHLVVLRKGKHYNKPLQADWDVYGKDVFAWNILEEVEGSWLELGFTARLLSAEKRHLDDARTTGEVYNTAKISVRHDEWLKRREQMELTRVRITPSPDVASITYDDFTQAVLMLQESMESGSPLTEEKLAALPKPLGWWLFNWLGLGLDRTGRVE